MNMSKPDTFPARRYWILVAALLPLMFAMGCGRIEAAGEAAGSPFAALSKLAIWSWAWLLPGVLMGGIVSSDRDEVQTVSGKKWDSREGHSTFTIEVPTGRKIPGDPEAGELLLVLWLTAYPIGYFYYPIFIRAHEIVLTGRPNLDWSLIKIAIPIAIVCLMFGLIGFARTSKSAFAQALASVWMLLIGCGVLNLAAWLVVILARWLMAK
jgi:hypothetical protein